MDGSPATRPPKEGDSVTIQAGHTIVFDTDMSGFPNGLAGLTINGTLLIPSLNDPSYQEVGEETSGTPWLSGWNYRRTVYVDNSFSSTPLTNFQIIIRLNTAYLIAQGKMRSDCGDIRVTDSSGNLLPIWIDPDTKNTWNTKIYVKVPSIPANSVVTIYLFYGNPDATDVSDGNSVFDFFDDFSGTALDTNKWTAARWTGTGSWSVTVRDGYVEINSGSGTRAGIVSKTAFAFPFIIEGCFRYISGEQVWNSITQTSGGSHNDLVEHGYASSGGTYFYRRASGGTYTNYQSFGRLAPRGGFAYFRQEWTTSSSRYFEYLPYEGQVNSTTTQDRYTSGSCYIQLSTIAGVAQWDWVAVRKFAATPPAVYFRTLTATTLKVNANIAGTGSFLIGSSSYSINYPQWTRILVNGTITVANFHCYGEQRSPLWDYLAQDAPTGATTIVLQNGLPLRSGDIIAIGRSDIVGHWTESSTARGLHTVASYNAATKTVTLNEALTHVRSGTGVRACLVILLSRQIVISKYGTNNVTLLSGSGRTIQGVLFQTESGAAVHSLTTATSSSFTYSSHIRFGGDNTAFLHVSGITLDNYTAYGGQAITRDPSGTNQVTNSAFINYIYGFHLSLGASSTFILENIQLQNCPALHSAGFGSITYTLQQCTCKNASLLTFHFANATGVYTFTISDVTLVDGSLVGSAPAATVIANISNIQMHGYLANDYFAVGQVVGMVVVKNLIGAHNNTARRITLAGSRADNVVFINCSLSGYGNGLGHNGAADCKYISCSLANAFNPIIQNHPSGVSEIINLSTNAYFRPTLRVPPVADQLWTNRIIVKGLTVAGNQHPKAFEHLFPHGYVKNRWDAATPDYTTFDFLLTQSGFAGQPIWLEYQVFTADPIRVTGTITHLGTNESVKVQIFSAGKEPLYGDTPDFERTYTATGNIDISWTPPSAGTWIVRVLAYLQQTMNPITIQNLQVAGGGTGGGGGDVVNIQVNDQMNVLAGETIQTQLAIQQAINAAISSSERVNPSITATVDDTLMLQSVDSVIAQFSLLPSELVQIIASEAIQSSLQASVSEVMQASVQDSVLPQLFASPSETVRVSTVESVLSSVAVEASDLTQVQADESQTVQVGVGVSESLRVSANEQATPVISFALTESGQVLSSEVSNVFTGFQLLVSDSMQVTTSESQSTNIAAQIVQQEAIQTSEAQTTQLGVSVADSASVTTSESSSIQIAGVVSETVRVSTSEQTSTQVQFSAVESVTQIEAETAPFIGLIQRLMIPVSVDLLRAVELSISITPVR
jgi:hypothetical protein